MSDEFLRFFGAPNESLRLIIIYYMFKNMIGKKNNFGRDTSEPKKPFKGSVLSKLAIST